MQEPSDEICLRSTDLVPIPEKAWQLGMGASRVVDGSCHDDGRSES